MEEPEDHHQRCPSPRNQHQSYPSTSHQCFEHTIWVPSTCPPLHQWLCTVSKRISCVELFWPQTRQSHMIFHHLLSDVTMGALYFWMTCTKLFDNATEYFINPWPHWSHQGCNSIILEGGNQAKVLTNVSSVVFFWKYGSTVLEHSTLKPGTTMFTKWSENHASFTAKWFFTTMKDSSQTAT